MINAVVSEVRDFTSKIRGSTVERKIRKVFENPRKLLGTGWEIRELRHAEARMNEFEL